MLNSVKYEPSSPSGLVWVKSKGNSVVGTNVGSYDSTCGYYRVGSKKNRKLCHRLIWELFNGIIPEGMIVDHIDGITTNNNIENLRLISASGNARNAKLYSSNKSGTSGVFFNREREKCAARWTAYWYNLEGKLKTKSFSVLKYGEELSRFLAEETRSFAILKLNLLGAGYTERHGEN